MPQLIPLPSAFAAVRKPLSELLRSRLGVIPPTWSLDKIRARVMGLRREASDTVSLLLHPNAHWRGFRAGQHVQLSVELGQARYTQTFAISSSPRSGTPLRITVRRSGREPVSEWVLNRARRNDIVELSPARGNFVLPRDLHGDVLFISGDSGITPVMSMVRDLLYSGHSDQITCMHYAGNEMIFESELDMLAHEFVNLNVVPYLGGTRAGAHDTNPHLSQDEVATVHPSWQQSETFVSGPAALVDAVTNIWAQHELTHRLHVAPSFATR